MKRFQILILICCLFLSGCSNTGERIKEPVTFYYIQENFQRDMDPVIVSEVREASGHKEDLPYLLALYSMGPSDEDMKSPLPRNTKIEPLGPTEDSLELRLSENVLTVSDVDYTLASACLSLTCIELTGVSQVTVVCGERSITMQKDTLMLTSSIQYIQEDTT